MSRTSRANARRRISLLASSGLVSSSVVAGLSAVAIATLAPTAVWAGCSPDSVGAGNTSGTAVANTATGEVCTGGETGIWYKATGNLTVVLQGAPVSTAGVGINDAVAGNLKIGVDTGVFTGGSIVNTAGDGIFAATSAGSVEIDTGSSVGPLAAATVVGSANGISGSGSSGVLINAYNNVTGTNFDGILAGSASSGQVIVNTGTNTGGPVTVTGGFDGIRTQDLGTGRTPPTTHHTQTRRTGKSPGHPPHPRARDTHQFNTDINGGLCRR